LLFLASCLQAHAPNNQQRPFFVIPGNPLHSATVQ
jgi:hypothetical protein